MKGMQTAIFEALEEMGAGDEVLAMGIRSSKEARHNAMWQRWHRERIQKKIVCKAVFSDEGTPYYSAFKKMKLAHVRILESITPSALDVMKDRVLIFTYGEEPSCLVINNAEVAQSFTAFFDTLWRISK